MRAVSIAHIYCGARAWPPPDVLAHVAELVNALSEQNRINEHVRPAPCTHGDTRAGNPPGAGRTPGARHARIRVPSPSYRISPCRRQDLAAAATASVAAGHKCWRRCHIPETATSWKIPHSGNATSWRLPNPGECHIQESAKSGKLTMEHDKEVNLPKHLTGRHGGCRGGLA